MIDLTGKLLAVQRDFKTRKYEIAFTVNEDLTCVSDLESLRADDELTIKVARKKDKRSLDSNSYFHLLARKLSQVLGISETACKNILISRYGQVEMFDDEAIIYKTNAPEEYMIEREEVHSKLIQIKEENNRIIYFYRIYRGSHTYNTEEMAKLIKGTVEECQAQGIETATPDELAHMAQLWGQKYEQSRKRSERREGVG